MSAADRVNCVRFNQDGSALAVALDSGVRIYNVDPLLELTSYGVDQFGSVALCEMLHRTNLLAIVAGGATPRFADNTVLVYDDHRRAFVHELTFGAQVLGIRMRRDRLIVTLCRQLYVFTLPDQCKRLLTVETGDNPLGLCAITPALATAERHLLAFPGRKTGSLQLLDLASFGVEGAGSARSAAGVSSAPLTVNAHQSPLAAIDINQQGTMVATASQVGTLVRIWDTSVGGSGVSAIMNTTTSSSKTGSGGGGVGGRCRLLAELRRGADSAVLHALRFSPTGHYLSCCSDKGTVHVFAIHRPRLNRRSPLAPLGATLPAAGAYLQSSWALATSAVPGAERRQCACVFGAAVTSGPNSGGRQTVFVACANGMLHRYLFNAETGQCSREACHVYLEECGAADF